MAIIATVREQTFQGLAMRGTDFENLNLGISGTWSFSDNAHIDYSIRHIDRETDFDRFDFFVTGLPADAENRTSSKYLYAGLSLEQKVSETLNHSITFNRTDSDNETIDADPVNDLTKGTKDVFKYQLNYLSSLHSFSALLEHESQDYTQSGQASFFGDPNKRLKSKTKVLPQNIESVPARLTYQRAGESTITQSSKMQTPGE